MPALAAAYAASSRIAMTAPVTDDTITTRPHPASRMPGRTARVARNAVSRLRDSAVRHRS